MNGEEHRKRSRRAHDRAQRLHTTALLWLLPALPSAVLSMYWTVWALIPAVGFLTLYVVRYLQACAADREAFQAQLDYVAAVFYEHLDSSTKE